MKGGVQPKKKIKGGVFSPFVSTGAIAASRSSTLEDTEYLARLNLRVVRTDSIFYAECANRGSPDDIVISQGVRQALKRPQDKEEVLRNAIYSELLTNHAIKFPASSELDAVERTLRSCFKWNLRYKETDLAHILHELHKHREDQEDAENEKDAEREPVLARLLHGLNVTTTSKPDMTIFRGKYLFFGEFKNNEKYTIEKTAKQCTLYLYALMFFFRVRLGLNAKAVFGFWVCGPGCFPGDEQYSVGFVRLSAPEQLGDSLVPHAFSGVYAVDDVKGIQQLISFLRFGRIIELNEDEAAVPVNCRIPALLTLPRPLWESPLLVINGTASMVFKGTGDEILVLARQFSRDPPPLYLSTFLSSANRLLEGNDGVFYLKIRLKETTLRESPINTVASLLQNDVFVRVYRPIEMYPIVPVGDGECGVFLMNNCGAALFQSEEFTNLTFLSFRACFATFWNDIVAMKDAFLHGDALPHNMVYNADSQKLFLVDVDEGTVGTNAHKRVIEEGGDNVCPYLRYPNFLRAWMNRQLYTELQLAVSFLLLVKAFVESMTENDKRLMRTLRTAAEEADSFLKRKNDKDPMSAYPSSIDPSVNKLVKLTEATLG